MGQERPVGEAAGTGAGLYAFEVLFQQILGGRREHALALTLCGYDPGRPRERYSAKTWARCLELARSRLFTDRPRDEGMRALGALFGKGMQQGPLGEAYAGVQLSRESYLRRLPALIRMARSDVEVELTCCEPRRWQLDLREPCAIPPFTLGVLETRLAARGVPATVELLHVEGDRFRIEIRW